MRIKRFTTGLVALGLASLVLSAPAASYTTLSDGGNAASPAEVIFPSSPGSQIRIVQVNWQTDTNAGALSFTTGVGAYTIQATNTLTGVTQVLNSVSGLAANDSLVLEHLGVDYIASLSSTNNGTNAVLASGAWGVYPAVGDSVYKMSSATTLPVGASTNFASGEAIFVGNVGRPVDAKLVPGPTTTNRLNSVTAHYD